MTIIRSDNLGNLFSGDIYSHRHTLWLWFHLVAYKVELPLGEISKQGLRDRMAAFLSIRPEIVEHIKTKKRNEIVSEKHFDWVNEGERQYEWLLQKTRSLITNLNYIPPTQLDRKSSLVMMFDIWEAGITDKKLLLNELKADWTTHKSGDDIFRWFKEDEQRCVLAWSHLKKNTPTLYTFPIDNYEDLMIFFDNSRMNPHEIILHIEKIKRKWSTRKSREKQATTGKSQCNFVLSNRVIEHLDKLASAHGLSRTKTLELLLQIDAEKNIYTIEITKRQKFFDSI